MKSIRVSEVRTKRIFVYGHGRGFQTLKAFLIDKYRLCIMGIVDKSYNTPIIVKGEPTLANLDFYVRNNIFRRAEDVIIVSIGCKETYNKLLRQLRSINAPETIWAKQIFEYHLSHSPREHNHDLEYEALINSGRVETSRAVYSDKKSLDVYDNFISFFSNKSEDLLPIKSDPIGQQYFPRDLEIPRDVSRFINAGAFDGDTLLSMKKNEIAKSDAIACFEPDLGNFRKLATLANSSTGEKISKQYYLFFCGLGSTISVTKFNAGALVNSSVDSSGHSTIPIVTLDAALPYFRPTFITMDIEGSEYDAIVGARDMICQSTPDLAIAIYHTIEQFLTIPLLIKSFKVGYRFYLRNYTGFPAESILYATTRP